MDVSPAHNGAAKSEMDTISECFRVSKPKRPRETINIWGYTGDKWINPSINGDIIYNGDNMG